MKYSLRSLLIVALLAPAVLAILYWLFVEIPSLMRKTRGLPGLEEHSDPPPNSPP